jgi:hypothetical protein
MSECCFLACCNLGPRRLENVTVGFSCYLNGDLFDIQRLRGFEKSIRESVVEFFIVEGEARARDEALVRVDTRALGRHLGSDIT